MADTNQQKPNERTEISIPSSLENAPLVAAVHTGEATVGSINPTEAPFILDKSDEFRWKFAEETHQYIRDYIKQADQKAAFFFAGYTALIAFLYKAELVQRWVKLPTQWALIDVLSFIATFCLAASTFTCLATIFPRMQGSKRGVVFFNAIAEFDFRKEYASDVLKRDIENLMEEKLCHVHDLAAICKKKFFMLKVGLWLGLIGVAAMILLLLGS